MRQLEAAVQRGIVDYLRTVAPECITFAVPNASHRTTGGYASNGVPGLYPGIPDLCCVAPGGRAHFIEVKARGGVLSKAQDAVRLRMALAGIPWCLAYGIDEVRTMLTHYGVPTREAR